MTIIHASFSSYWEQYYVFIYVVRYQEIIEHIDFVNGFLCTGVELTNTQCGVVGFLLPRVMVSRV